jgi:hypothetical protein
MPASREDERLASCSVEYSALRFAGPIKKNRDPTIRGFLALQIAKILLLFPRARGMNVTTANSPYSFAPIPEPAAATMLGMASANQVRGVLLEEAILMLLRASGYRTVSDKTQLGYSTLF